MAIYKHKVHGWLLDTSPARFRGDCSGRQLVTPAEGGAERVIHTYSAGSWQNHPLDDRSNINRDRIIVEGEPLPAWAQEWVLGRWKRVMAQARGSFQAAMNDADNNAFGRDSGW